MENTFYFISVFFILSGIICTVIILFDLFPHRRQPMKIMEVVWPLTGLWASWLGLWAYWKLGRVPKGTPAGNMEGMNMGNRNMGNRNQSSHPAPEMNMPARHSWQSITLSTLHCGAGCTLADLIGETFTSFVPLAIFSSPLAGQWVLDYLLPLADHQQSIQSRFFLSDRLAIRHVWLDGPLYVCPVYPCPAASSELEVLVYHADSHVIRILYVLSGKLDPY